MRCNPHQHSPSCTYFPSPAMKIKTTTPFLSTSAHHFHSSSDSSHFWHLLFFGSWRSASNGRKQEMAWKMRKKRINITAFWRPPPPTLLRILKCCRCCEIHHFLKPRKGRCEGEKMVCQRTGLQPMQLQPHRTWLVAEQAAGVWSWRGPSTLNQKASSNRVSLFFF